MAGKINGWNNSQANNDRSSGMANLKRLIESKSVMVPQRDLGEIKRTSGSDNPQRTGLMYVSQCVSEEELHHLQLPIAQNFEEYILEKYAINLSHGIKERLFYTLSDGRAYQVKLKQTVSEFGFGEIEVRLQAYIVLVEYDDAQVGEEVRPGAIVSADSIVKIGDKTFERTKQSWLRTN